MGHQRKIHETERGESWWLCRSEDGEVFILREDAAGEIGRYAVSEFLAISDQEAQQRAFMRLVGELTGLRV